MNSIEYATFFTTVDAISISHEPRLTHHIAISKRRSIRVLFSINSNVNSYFHYRTLLRKEKNHPPLSCPSAFMALCAHCVNGIHIVEYLWIPATTCGNDNEVSAFSKVSGSEFVLGCYAILEIASTGKAIERKKITRWGMASRLLIMGSLVQGLTQPPQGYAPTRSFPLNDEDPLFLE